MMWLPSEILLLSAIHIHAASGVQEKIFMTNSSIISCGGNNTITIVDLDVEQNSTPCSQYEHCNLTEEQKTLIKMSCNKESSCSISTIIPNACMFNNYGHVSISYSCTNVVNSSCNFENGACGCTVSGYTSYMWKTRSGKTSKSSAGPDKDHTSASGDGNYVYTESTKWSKPNDESDLFTSLILPNPKQCLTFWYHMYGIDINTLKVFQQNMEHHIQLWNKSANQGNKWHVQSLSLNDIGPYQIMFKAIRGNGHKSEIAIDDILITNTDCNKGSSLDCNFEENTCGWNVENTSQYMWIITSGDTLDDNTGPLVDHTYGLYDGNYIYLEASNIQPEQNSNLTSVTVSPDGDACFTFWFHMNGNRTGTLNIYLVSDEMTQKLWSNSGNNLDIWQLAFVDISISESYQITLEGVWGSSKKGDIAVDDIALLPGSCNKRASFLDCNFEGGTCNWFAFSETSYIWKSTATEYPSQDIGQYIYLENSVSDIPAVMRSNLTSRTISPAGYICLTFRYYLHNENKGTLNVYTESGNTSQIHWSQSGNKENTWKFANFTISISEAYRIIFEGIRGDSDKFGYIAIDDISLLERSCSGLIKTSQTCHNIDESISLHECSKYYLQLNETSLEFDPKFGNCSAACHDVQTSITTLCNDPNSSDICTFDLPKLLRKDHRCFRPNWLSVEYRCEVSDKSVTLSASMHNDNDSSTGLVVGMVIGGLLLAIVVVLIVVLIRRHRFKSKPEEKMRTNLGGNDYIGSQDIALSRAHTANHSSHMKYFDKQTSIDDEYATVYPSAETNLNEIKEDGNQTADSYMILDPNDTGFNRTTFSHTPTVHEFSKPVKDTGHKIINDDPYDISVEGVYDHSENNRHKELEVDIYNHAVDTFYDSGSHKRNDKGIEDTYDHFFGLKTEDDYDVSTTT